MLLGWCTATAKEESGFDSIWRGVDLGVAVWVTYKVARSVKDVGGHDERGQVL